MVVSSEKISAFPDSGDGVKMCMMVTTITNYVGGCTFSVKLSPEFYISPHEINSF